ncbi:GNAT family N-acetyltransferase [Phenylobacterium sp.]|uniref:GNAT family N-acetyltransferase n=1 Tax=Phenylobacterium sp. TaxID=1871053 RepID=UPI00271EEF75|nr:GNAT family N-acetyltransferase [Phenylobacterium sp.]MDO8378974.1 GNAT family N-acetyltransferase [Phenylobacterium sp.]
MALALLETNLATAFVTSETGRIVSENEPGLPPGPRLYLAGCRDGTRVRLRHDVDDETARIIEALVARQAPWVDPATDPACLADLLALLALLAPVESVSRSILYRMPHGLTQRAGATILRGDTAEGRAWLARLSESSMPQHLLDAGFLGAGDFWDPWCMALEGETIAAMAFAARNGPRGAEVGVYTFPGFRGRGLAAAVTAAWSGLAELADRPLFYSTLTTNTSSQKVAARLGLPVFGAGIRVS